MWSNVSRTNVTLAPDIGWGQLRTTVLGKKCFLEGEAVLLYPPLITKLNSLGDKHFVRPKWLHFQLKRCFGVLFTFEGFLGDLVSL